MREPWSSAIGDLCGPCLRRPYAQSLGAINFPVIANLLSHMPPPSRVPARGCRRGGNRPHAHRAPALAGPHSSAAGALDRVAINSGSRAMPRQRSGAPHPTCEAFRLMGAPARERAGLSCRIAATARAARTHHGPRRKAAAAFSQGSRLPTRGVRTALSGSAANGG